MDADNITGAYDQAAAGYDTSRVGFFQPVARQLVAYTGVGFGENVLDAGCGTGAATIAAAEAVGGPVGQVTAIDTSPAMLTRCRAACRAAGVDGRVAFRRADAADPPVSAWDYDVILASMLVFMLPDLPATLNRWRGLLAGPDSRIGFSWRESGDPRWASAIAALDAYLPAGVGSWEQYVLRPPFNDARAVMDMVSGAGYQNVTASVKTLGMRFTSPEEWMDAVRYTGYSASWQHIPERDRPAAKAAALDALEQYREPSDGSISRFQAIGYLRATR